MRLKYTTDTPPAQVVTEKKRVIKRDLTLTQLKQYDGKNEEGLIYIACNFKIFDVSFNGKQFYGPGGPYNVFAGRDASRALATFNLDKSAIPDEFDDLSQLNSEEVDRMKEWEMQFTAKYDYVGKLLKPGEEPAEYPDSDAENSEKKIE